MKNYSLILPTFLIVLLFTQCGEYGGYKEGLYYEYVDNEKYGDYGENPFRQVTEFPNSSFAVDADGASFSNTRRFLMQGEKPPVASVRIEEYLNYFPFNYEAPTDKNIALNYELTTCPWNAEHYLLRLGIKGIEYAKEDIPSANYVFLVDVSGSMDAHNKLPMLKEGLRLLVDNMKSSDRIAIVTYSADVKVELQSTHVENNDEIKRVINSLRAEGSTNGSQAIQKAYEIAEQNFLPGGNNRVILGTDGDFNVGITNNDELVSFIEEKRENGVFLTVLGFGTGNLNDEMMEQLANNGNGNYEYIDNGDQIKKVFVDEVSKLFTVAKDCKIQIRFNETSVDSYRLIGYENRTISDTAYNNDSTDAGEIGAGQTITAVYELVLKEETPIENFAVFTARYKKATSDVSNILKLVIDKPPINIEDASAETKFAASLTAFGLIMKESIYKGNANKSMVLNLGSNIGNYDPHGYRDDFFNMVSDNYFE